MRKITEVSKYWHANVLGNFVCDPILPTSFYLQKLNFYKFNSKKYL